MSACSPLITRRVQRGTGPTLFRALPKQVADKDYFVYDALRQPVEFSGGLLLGADFIRALYVHMGFQRAWKYENVYEVTFERGRLVEERDRSHEMASFREKLDPFNLESSPRAGDEDIAPSIWKLLGRYYPPVEKIDLSGRAGPIRTEVPGAGSTPGLSSLPGWLNAVPRAQHGAPGLPGL